MPPDMTPPGDDLRYPFVQQRPAPGQAVKVVPGVYWLRMPLPYVLDHVNVWALEDGEGWTVVDAGVHTPEVEAAWEAALAGPLGGRPVTRVIVTHFHPDHVGMAGWFADRFGCELWMTRGEYFQCRAAIAERWREMPEAELGFYRRAGWGEAGLDACRKRFGKFAERIAPLPDRYWRIRGGDIIRIGAHDWQVVIGTGHSPEHACLVCPELGVMISGDQVLPRITTNVSVQPFEPEADPLSDWLSSIRRLRESLGDGLLVLPSHKDLFHGLHTRLSQLARAHADAEQKLLGLLATPRRTIDVFSALFARPIDGNDPALLFMATGESQAFLNHLLARGHITRRQDADGVSWYALATPATS